MKTLKDVWAKKSSKTIKNSIAATAVALLTLGTAVTTPLVAGGTIRNIMNQIAGVLKEVYSGFLIIVTLLAVVLIAWCLLVRMFSKNPRAVDEATQWIKRICITWLCFMLLSVLVSFGMDVVNTAGGVTTNPWEVTP